LRRAAAGEYSERERHDTEHRQYRKRFLPTHWNPFAHENTILAL